MFVSRFLLTCLLCIYLRVGFFNQVVSNYDQRKSLLGFFVCLFLCYCCIFSSVLGIGHTLIFFIIYLCLCVSVYMHVVPSEARKGIGPPGAGVRGGYDVLHVVVAGNLTVALWKSSAQSEVWSHVFIL